MRRFSVLSFSAVQLAFAFALTPRLVGAQDADPFAIEDVLSSPFPSSLVAAPNHGKLAWVRNAEGRRNLWVAEAPSYEGRRVTDYQHDDGQALTELQFGPGANHIVFVRGGAPNRAGEIPNPRSRPEEVERSIWIVETTGDDLRKLADGASPTFSPDGRTVAYIANGDIWTVPAVDQGDPKRLAAIRGSAASLRFSPTGDSLAFVSRRSDHGFVGVYDLKEDRVRFLDPALALDEEPVFSPDGKRLAFIRRRNEREVLPFMPRREGIPWSIRVADVASGRGEEIWRAEPGPGSVFRGIVAMHQLVWTASGHVVFPWEREGFTHLYSVEASGGSATLLTPGNFEVEDVFLGPRGREIFYSSNEGDVDRRHIWRVSPAGGPPVAVTKGKGIEWSPVVTGDDGAIAYLSSDARHPAHAVVHLRNDEPRPLVADWLPDRFPIDRLVEPEPVLFRAADGLQIPAQLFLPPNRGSGERSPAAIFFHGGSRRQMLLGWHYRGYYHNAYAFNQYLASRGYVVLSVNYRSGIGYGMTFREALDYGARGASEFNDVVGAGLYLQSRDDVDPARIGLWGGSYGGYLTALGLARASHLFAVGVDIHGVHDWNVVIRNFVPGYNAEKRADFARLAFESSPMADIDGWRSPVLLIHGDDDRNVPFSESVDLAESLSRRGIPYEELVFPDEVHGFLLHANWVAGFRAAGEFFDAHIGVRSRPSN